MLQVTGKQSLMLNQPFSLQPVTCNLQPVTVSKKLQSKKMALIIIGVIIILLGLAITRTNDVNFRRFASPVRLIGGIMVLIGILIACIIQIEAGEIGVKKLFGQV